VTSLTVFFIIDSPTLYQVIKVRKLKLEALNQIGIFQEFATESIFVVMFNFILCMLLLSIVSWFYKSFSRSLGGKVHVGSILPLIGLTVFLIIVVVKSSLALSLGLVGALSIVRFRTPIKEPEELVYLFLSISIGLGYGAGYPLITSLLVTLILISNYFFTNNNKKLNEFEYNLIIDKNNKELKYDYLIETISEYTDNISLVRIDSNFNNHSVVFKISLKSKIDIDSIIKRIQDKDTNISFFESKTNW
jgi:hypothetical protein